MENFQGRRESLGWGVCFFWGKEKQNKIKMCD
jgi:hypothetical protein